VFVCIRWYHFAFAAALGKWSVMSLFQPIERDTDFLFPPSINDWLPEQHLARFVVEIVEQLDLKAMERAYRCTGRCHRSQS